MLEGLWVAYTHSNPILKGCVVQHDDHAILVRLLNDEAEPMLVWHMSEVTEICEGCGYQAFFFFKTEQDLNLFVDRESDIIKLEPHPVKEGRVLRFRRRKDTEGDDDAS